jgi:hypothetical protein
VKLGIVQQQVSKFGALLNKIKFAIPFALRSNSAVGMPTSSLSTYPESLKVKV